MSSPSARERNAPWVEGAVLAALVLAALLLGGEVVRASYHGYMHAAIGEAVLRDGLLPENPYHAGVPLRYYTLYPVLGVVLGRLGLGPFGGFTLLSVLAAFLTAPALDALGRAFGLGFAARRAAFLACVLGLGGLGWLGFLGGVGEEWGEAPLVVLARVTASGSSFGWDARIDTFASKLLNASSWAPSLPFLSFALAAAARAGARPRELVLPLAVALALNPLAGGFGLICVALWRASTLFAGPVSARLAWPAAALLAVLLASPFLAPALGPAPDGPRRLVVELSGNRLANLVGPLHLLLLPALLGLRELGALARWRWIAAALVAALALHFAALPFGNEYKFARLLALLAALPAGACAAAAWSRGGVARFAALAVGLLAVPTLVLTLASYVAWGRAAPPEPFVASGGRLVPRAEREDEILPAPVLAALDAAPHDAVVLLHPDHPGSRAGGAVIQGNRLAPVLRRTLVVDAPQVHNDRQRDLGARLAATRDFFGKVVAGRPARGTPAEAFAELRRLIGARDLLVLSHVELEAPAAVLHDLGAEVLVESHGYRLWLVPAGLGGGSG